MIIDNAYSLFDSQHAALLGVSCGTLIGANIILPFVACVFHDVNTMTGLFIHLMPPMVMYTFMWHSNDIRAAWPMIFHLNYMDKIHYFPKTGPFFAPGTVSSSVFSTAIVLHLLYQSSKLTTPRSNSVHRVWIVLLGMPLSCIYFGGFHTCASCCFLASIFRRSLEMMAHQTMPNGIQFFTRL